VPEQGAGTGRDIIEFDAINGLNEGLASGEVPVERANSDPGGGGDVL